MDRMKDSVDGARTIVCDVQHTAEIDAVVSALREVVAKAREKPVRQNRAGQKWFIQACRAESPQARSDDLAGTSILLG